MSRSDLQAASWLHHMHVTCCNMHVTGLLQTMQDEIPTSYWGRLDRRWTIGAATGAGYIAFDVASAIVSRCMVTWLQIGLQGTLK